jgi:hypothetical protein
MTDRHADNYEVVFRVAGEAVAAKTPQWFIEGFYTAFEDAQRAAQQLIASTHEKLDLVSILHAQLDSKRAAFKERVVWTSDRNLALLSRLNLQPLEAGIRTAIVAHFDRAVAQAAAVPSPIRTAELHPPSAIVVGLTSTLTAAFCALGVLVVLA